MHEFKNTSNGSSNYRFGRVAVGDFNGDGSRDIALTKTSSWSYDYNEYIRVAALFMNDGTGHFQTGYFVSLAGYPDTMQGVAFNRWVEGGVVQIVPFLWPVNVTSPDVLSINNQMLTGTGPSQAMIYVKEGDKEMGQTTVGADGRWSYIFSPGLSEGYHSLRLFASDPEGRVSAEKQFTILVKDASRWQNSRNPLDVDNDQTITPLDVLSVVNYINAYGAGLLPTSGISPPPYYDVDADGSVSPLDVLSIVNYLNQQSGSGEGESSSISAHESTFSEESPPCEALYTDSDFDRVFASKDLFDSIGQDLYQKMRFFRKLRR